MVKSFPWAAAAFCCMLMSHTLTCAVIWRVKVHAGNDEDLTLIYDLPLSTPLPKAQKHY